MKIKHVLIFGNEFGIPQLIKHIPNDIIDGIVIASNRTVNIDNYKIPILIQPIRTLKNRLENFKCIIEEMNPELIFVHSYSMYIPKEILDIPTYGSINIHFAALPKYRGANPIQWAIINGEIENGITIHYMNEKIDSGNIISQRLVPIEFTDTWIDVIFKCFKSCDEMLYTDINDILNIKNKSIPQDESIATTYHRRTPEDGEFELNDTPIKIYNKIRALVHPLPGAFFYDENKYKHIINRFIPLEKVINKSYTT